MRWGHEVPCQIKTQDLHVNRVYRSFWSTVTTTPIISTFLTGRPLRA